MSHFCSNCGAKLEDDEMFCGSCGADQREEYAGTGDNAYTGNPYGNQSGYPTPQNVVYTSDPNAGNTGATAVNSSMAG